MLFIFLKTFCVTSEEKKLSKNETIRHNIIANGLFTDDIFLTRLLICFSFLPSGLFLHEIRTLTLDVQKHKNNETDLQGQLDEVTQQIQEKSLELNRTKEEENDLRGMLLPVVLELTKKLQQWILIKVKSTSD